MFAWIGNLFSRPPKQVQVVKAGGVGIQAGRSANNAVVANWDYPEDQHAPEPQDAPGGRNWIDRHPYRSDNRKAPTAACGHPCDTCKGRRESDAVS